MVKAFIKGDMVTVQSYWADDIVWYFPGNSLAAGVFRGKDAVMEHLSQGQRHGIKMELTPKAFFGDDNYGAVLYENTLTRNNMAHIENRLMLCNVANNKVIEVRIYPDDLYALDEFLS